jgi:hypothetical protein
LLVHRKDKINTEYAEIERMGKFLHYFERYKGHGQSLEVRHIWHLVIQLHKYEVHVIKE